MLQEKVQGLPAVLVEVVIDLNKAGYKCSAPANEIITTQHNLLDKTLLYFSFSLQPIIHHECRTSRKKKHNNNKSWQKSMQIVGPYSEQSDPKIKPKKEESGFSIGCIRTQHE